MVKSSLASSLIGKSKLATGWLPVGDEDSEGKGSSGGGGIFREETFSDSGGAGEETSSFAEGESEGVFSGREPGWGRHAEDRNKIIPTAKVLYVIHPSFRVGYKIEEIEREKIYRLMT
jgi:hypothetical protein